MVGSLVTADSQNGLYGTCQIADARIVGMASSTPEGKEYASRRDTAIGFAVDLLAHGELHDGELSMKDADAFRKYVDPSSELYEFEDDEVEPGVVFQGGSLNIAAETVIADAVGNTFFVDVDRRIYTGEGSAMYQHVSELAVVLNDNGLVQEAYYN